MDEQSRPIAEPATKAWLAWMVFVAGLLTTVGASLYVRQGIERDAAKTFAFTSDQVTLKIRERLGAYALILRGASALFAASGSVERRQWHAYVETLRASKSVPGVQGIGFSSVIPPGQLADHIARVRAEGFPEYTVRPPGERVVMTSIVYLEPFSDRNLRAFGFDMFSEPVRRAAMERARDSGEATLSGKVELVQETGNEVQAGTLMYVPVYRNGAPVATPEQRRMALLGWVYSPYRMNDLMGGILADWSSGEGKALDLEIYAGSAAAASALLFKSVPAAGAKVTSLFDQRRSMDVNGASWTLAFNGAETASNVRYTAVWMTAIGGLALSGMLHGLMLATINTRANAVRMAGELTGEIRRSEESLKRSEASLRFSEERMIVAQQISHTGSWIYDVEKTTLWGSAEGMRIFGYSPVAGNFPVEGGTFCTPEPERMGQALLALISEGRKYDLEYTINPADGSPSRVIHSIGTLEKDAQGEPLRVLGFVQDVTDRVNAENAFKRAVADLRQFAEITAHHLQEPARRILSYVERLTGDLAQYVKNPEIQTSLDVITSQARRERDLLRHIDLYLAADQPLARIEQVDARRIVAGVLDRLKARIGGAGAEIALGDLPPAWIDAPRLATLFSVALENALGHGRNEQGLRIAIDGERIGPLVRYRVADNGAGIEAQYRERVFRVFERLTQANDGTGVGLAIMRRIAESCGGKAWIEETPGGGCCVVFELTAEDTS
jgi:CHASE1-domain containing sensor protein/signal transduction histidine kinase